MKVAIVHDWLTGMRGGERALEVFCRLFPDAPVFTLFHFRGHVSPLIESHPIHTSWMQNLPGLRQHYRKYLALYPMAIESLDLSEFDLVVSTSHAVAKGAIAAPHAKSICYCHTPMRYIWDQFEAYFGANHCSTFTRWAALLFRDYLREWDQRTADRVDWFLCNSAFVAQRIDSIYNRSSHIIHPPVDTSFYTPSEGTAEDTPNDSSNDFYLVVSALAPYKRLDLAIDAFSHNGKNLVVIGFGPEQKKLFKNVPSNIDFKGNLSDIDVRAYYRRCRALIFPGIEDFGLTPIEVQACGRPVIAFAAGGVIETVSEGISGHFFHSQTPEALIQAVEEFESMFFDSDELRRQALRFSTTRMIEELVTFFSGTIPAWTPPQDLIVEHTPC